MILTDLWKKRREEIWLFLELIVITVVAWFVIDPAVVNLYFRNLPMGYDTDQLLLAETKENAYTEDAPFMTPDERKMQIIRQLESMDGVESVYLYGKWSYEALGNNNPSYCNVGLERDSLYMAQMTFVEDAQFFETYGLRPLPGSPSAEELSKIRLQDKQDKAILTRNAALTLFGTDDVVGRRFQNHVPANGTFDVTVAGVVEDLRLSVARNVRAMVFFPGHLLTTDMKLNIRLKKGINATRFIEENGRELIAKGKTDFCRISKLTTFEDHLRKIELDEGRTQELNRSLALALFFLINLSLAVIGTVWLQAKRRTEECGVRRAFGATRSRLLLSLLTEGALLATAACLIGCIIYLNYAYSGLDFERGEEFFTTMYRCSFWTAPADQTWVDHFWPHFLIVSGIVYLIILCTVLIGTTIPALKIVNTKVTDALRDE
ncbi:MAG: FtsX-like permease family protein [Bacteroidaceae bacterium]|nr:FtsX-like permease family protein [Bacteroidaceae bacterium]